MTRDTLAPGIAEENVMDEDRPLNLTPTEALGVALSVAAPTMVMGDAQAAAPDMRAHLEAMGYTLTRLATPVTPEGGER